MGSKKVYIVFYIYKTTNLINGKIYVGQRYSTVLPELDISYLGSGLALNRSIKKYGKENFQKEIIELCAVENLDEREIYWIAFYNANDRSVGYNLTKGGEGVRGYQFSDEQRKNLSDKMKGRPSKMKGIKGKPSPIKGKKKEKPVWNKGVSGYSTSWKGRHHSESTVTNMKKAQLRHIYVIKTPENNTLEENSLTQFCKKNDLSRSALIKTLRMEHRGVKYFQHKGYSLLIKKSISEVITKEEVALKLEQLEKIINNHNSLLKYLYIIRLPNGEIETSNNISKFSKKNNLDGAALQRTFTNTDSKGATYTQHKGYKMISKEPIDKSQNKAA